MLLFINIKSSEIMHIIDIMIRYTELSIIDFICS